MKPFWKNNKALILFSLFAVICISIFYGTGIIDSVNVEALSEWVRRQGIVGALVYVLAYTLRPLVFFPAVPLTLFGGYTFGALYGTILDVIGAGTGAVLAFFIARRLGYDNIQSFIRGKKIDTMDVKIEKNGFLVVLYLRLIPLLPFDSINYGMGLSKVKARDYIAATYIGIIPGAFVFNYLGESLRDVASTQFWIAIGLYGVMIVLPLIVKRRKRKRSEQGT